MHQRKKMPLRKCCMQQCGYQLNPLEAANTFIAGAACDTCMVIKEACPMPYAAVELETMQEPAENGRLLAAAHMPDQQYLAGYCPDETLRQGTLFPELVRLYTD